MTLSGVGKSGKLRSALRFLLVLLVLFSLQDPARAQQSQPPAVVVSKPIAEMVVDWDEYTGRFQAVQTVDLQARVTGYLASIHFEDGQLVEENQLLYTIDQRPFELAVKQANARLQAAEATRDLALLEFERARELFNRNVGPQSAEQRTSAAYQEALANVALSEAELEIAELDLQFTQIRSPINGRIAETQIDIGDLVIGGPSGATALTTIVSVDPIEFVFTASEADFLKYARLNATGERGTSRTTPNPIFVRLQDEAAFERGGAMDFVDNRLDPNSGTILGRAVFENPEGFLQPGLFGRARLLGSGEFEALLIPDSAIVADQARSIIYVVNESNVVETRQVVRGEVWSGLRIIRSGLSAEDSVVISGLQRVRPGNQVAPVLEQITLPAAE